MVVVGQRGLAFNDLDGMWRFAVCLSKSGLAPKGIQTPEAILVAMQLGAEVGLTPMAALQNIAVINGRPSLWGDAQLAVVRGTGDLEEFDEWVEVGGKRQTRSPKLPTDDTTSVCRVKRKGYPAREGSFSVSDAKASGLWSKDGPWKQYPFRMLQMRARSFVLRDCFGDALRGMRSAEEMIGPVIDIDTAPAETSPVGDTVKLFAPPAETETVTAAPAPAAEPNLRETPEPPVSKAAPAEKTGEPGPQDRLSLYLDDYEISMDEFNTWAVQTGQILEPIARWCDLDAEVAKKLYVGRRPMVNCIVAMKGGAK